MCRSDRRARTRWSDEFDNLELGKGGDEMRLLFKSF